MFYIIAIVACAIMYWYSPWEWVAYATGGVMPEFMEAYETGLYATLEENPLLNIIQEAFFSVHTGIALYIIVMFIGALPKTPRVQRLFAIRSEMSILGGIYVFGHAFMRVSTVIYYFTEDISQATLPLWLERYNIVLYGALMLVLALVFVVPWVTSFPPVRKRMKASTWKKLQRRTCYPFYALMLGIGMAVGVDFMCSGIAQFAEGVWVVSGDLSTFPGWMIAASGMFWIYFWIAVVYLYLKLKMRRKDSTSPQDA